MPNYEDPLKEYLNDDPDRTAKVFYIYTRLIILSTFVIAAGVILYILFSFGIL